jgi:hypothetical protein
MVSVSVLVLVFLTTAQAGDQTKESRNARQITTSDNWSLQRDIAFTSVWGSRPDLKNLKGFERAVLYNARGEVVRRLSMRGDSIYSLDKMIQEHRSRGPLYIRMFRK